MKDFVIFLVCAFGLVFLIYWSAIGLVGASCYSQARAMQITEVSFGPLQGCIVRWNGVLVPIEAIGNQNVKIQKD